MNKETCVVRGHETRRVRRWTLAMVGALALAGCQADLQRGLDERQADAVVVALDAHGIGATKEAELGGGDEASFVVRVAPDDVAAALVVLRAEGLPHDEAPGLADVFGAGSLVPTATEERARLVAALSGELARSIETIDGVLEARVHVALPEPSLAPLDAPRPRPRASVLVRYRGERRPYDEPSIQRLVAGAIEDMTPEDVAIVGVPAPEAPASERELSQVGPFAVSRSSAGGVKAALGGLLAGNVLLALGLLAAFLRGSRLDRALTEAKKDAKGAKDDAKKAE